MDISNLVLPKNSLKNELLVADIVKILVAKFKELPNLNLKKNDSEFIKFISNTIENIPDLNNKKTDKKQVVITIISAIIPGLKEEELKWISNHIEFLHTNGFIKKVSSFKKAKYNLLNFFSSKHQG